MERGIILLLDRVDPAVPISYPRASFFVYLCHKQRRGPKNLGAVCQKICVIKIHFSVLLYMILNVLNITKLIIYQDIRAQCETTVAKAIHIRLSYISPYR